MEGETLGTLQNSLRHDDSQENKWVSKLIYGKARGSKYTGFSSLKKKLKYNSYTLKITLLKCTTMWFLVYPQSYATITGI